MNKPICDCLNAAFQLHIENNFSFPELVRHFKLLKLSQQLEVSNIFVTSYAVYFLNCAGTSK